jgi:hypothetical protein
MWTRSRLALAALAAVLTLAFAVGGAAAARLRFTSTSFSMKWREFHVPTGQTEEEPEERMRHCPITLSGSFHSTTMAKVVGALAGYVTSATMGTCTGEGGAVVLLRTGPPWHLTYRSFTGVLPAITRFRLALSGFGMSIEVPPLFGIVCLIRTTPVEPLNIDFVRERAGAITSVGGTESRIFAGAPCNGLEWTMGGSATLDNGAGARFTVTLI